MAGIRAYVKTQERSHDNLLDTPSHGEILGRLEVRWEKVACWSTKAAISLKPVKIEEKLLWRAYRKSPMLF